MTVLPTLRSPLAGDSLSDEMVGGISVRGGRGVVRYGVIVGLVYENFGDALPAERLLCRFHTRYFR